MPSVATAGVILQVTSGTGSAIEFFVESFTTPSGGPWNNIAFNFYSNVPATTPVALGNAFLLTSEYLGTPSALSSATPGFLAESVTSGQMYIFAPSVVLNSGTEYWLYANGLMTTTGSGAGGGAGGQAYFATSSSTDFSALGGGQLSNFTLQSIPEPTTLVVAGAGLFLLASIRVLRHC